MSSPSAAASASTAAALPQEVVGAGGTGSEARQHITFTIEDHAEKDDTMWARVHSHGTATGPFFGPPSGRTVDLTVIDNARIFDGRIVEHWGVPDRFAMLAQTGLLDRPV